MRGREVHAAVCANQRIAGDAEAVRAGLLSRLSLRGPNPRPAIENLELAREGLKAEITEIDDQISEFERDDKQPPIGWDRSMMGMGDDLEAVEEEADRRGAQLDARLRRGGRLAPAGEGHIDELLRQVGRPDEKTADVDAVAFANAGLEAQIAKIQRELDMGIQGMATERNRLAQQVERQRALLSMRVKEIVCEIRELRQRCKAV
jgi:DNA repair ATPase RecN